MALLQQGHGRTTRLSHLSTGRIVWNRPLPRRFRLALDVTVDTPRARIVVSLGDQRELVALSRRGPAHVEFDNPLGLRELGLASAPPGARLHVRRAAVR